MKTFSNSEKTPSPFDEMDYSKLRYEAISKKWVALLRIITFAQGQISKCLGGKNAMQRSGDVLRNEIAQVVEQIHVEIRGVLRENVYRNLITDQIIFPVFNLAALSAQAIIAAEVNMGGITVNLPEDHPRISNLDYNTDLTKNIRDMTASILTEAVDNTGKQVLINLDNRRAKRQTKKKLEQLHKNIETRRMSKHGKTPEDWLKYGEEIPIATYPLMHDDYDDEGTNERNPDFGADLAASFA